MIKNKILVTGSTGFVGQTLVPALVMDGRYEIAILVRNIEKAQSMFADIIDQLTIISTATPWAEGVTSFNPDVTIHLATFFTTGSDLNSAKEIIDTNILFTTLLLETLSHTGCSCFVNIGTFSEYQYGAGQFKANNLYSASKTAVRPIIQFFQNQCKFKWINVIVYSPYGRVNSGKKIIDYLVDAVGAPRPVSFSGGEQILDFIHVDDMASFFLKLLEKFDTLEGYFHQFHLGTGQGYSLRQVADVVGQVFGNKVNARWGALPYRHNDIMYAVAPIAANINLLQWRSRITLEQGLTILRDNMLTNVNRGGVISNFLNPVAA